MARTRPSDDIADRIPLLRAFAWTLCRKQQEFHDLVPETPTKGIGACGRYQRGTDLRSWPFNVMRNTVHSTLFKTTRERPATLRRATR